jgi:hypothetical protein
MQTPVYLKLRHDRFLSYLFHFIDVTETKLVTASLNKQQIIVQSIEIFNLDWQSCSSGHNCVLRATR